MDRRRFIGVSAGALAAAASGLPLLSRGDTARPRLAMPPLLDTRRTGKLALTGQPGQSRFLGGAVTNTAGYNQGYLGPTIVMKNGPLATTVDNKLPETITVHWHGLLVPGEHDGSAHTPVEPGKRWAVDMQIDQQPATLWYHSHAHGATARHVYFGLAGVIHQTDGRDDQRGLPSTYGVDDLTLVLQDRRFDDNGRMVYNPDGTDILNGFQGEHMLVNGQFDAVAAVPKGLVRLRLLNGSNARMFTLHFNDQRPLHLIGTDGGFLEKPRALNYLRMSPGQRMEVLVDFSEGSATPVLMSAAGLTLKILDFAVDERLPVRITRPPAALDAVPFPEPTGEVRSRRIALNMGGASTGQGRIETSLSGGHAGHAAHNQVALIGAGADGMLMGTTMADFGVNGRPHDMKRIDFEVRQGVFERWTVNGGGAGVEHPFHVHGVHFRVESVGGADPGPENIGWKDTVLITGQAEILVRFDYPAAKNAPYMLHCHILEHEDAGMMAQFAVG